MPSPCRFMNDTHMTAASRPHVLCDAMRLRIDPGKMTPARCPKHRPRCEAAATIQDLLYWQLLHSILSLSIGLWCRGHPLMQQALAAAVVAC